MKRYLCFIVAIVVMMSANLCFAEVSRIDELKVEQEKVLKEIQAGQQYIQNKQVEALKIQGAIEELQRPESKSAEVKT
jgi:peptidoglycan hydrolase CwlO-like protein